MSPLNVEGSPDRCRLGIRVGCSMRAVAQSRHARTVSYAPDGAHDRLIPCRRRSSQPLPNWATVGGNVEQTRTPARRMDRSGFLETLTARSDQIQERLAPVRPHAVSVDGERSVVMATVVLVPPAWMGAWCWAKVAPPLREFGHDVHTLTLTGVAERAHLATPHVSLSTHIQDVVSLVEFNDLRDVILIGTSSGGAVITGAADRLAERISTIVYLDAFLLSDGQCILDLQSPERRQALQQLVDTEGDGWLLPRFAAPPWPTIVREMWQVTDEGDINWMLELLRPMPFRHFSEPVQLQRPGAIGPNRIYIRCTAMPAPPFEQAASVVRTTPG